MDDEDYECLKYYDRIKVASFTDLLNVSLFYNHDIFQVAVKRKEGYFHHFILKVIPMNYNCWYTVELDVLHKTIGDVPQILGAVFHKKFSIIKLENYIVKWNEKTYQYDTSNECVNLFDFQEGLYLLGDYDNITREEAFKKGKMLVGHKEIYSAKYSNCEHFTNFCFINKSISYQVLAEQKFKAAFVDGLLGVETVMITMARKDFIIQNQEKRDTMTSLPASTMLASRTTGYNLQVPFSRFCPVMTNKIERKGPELDKSFLYKEVTKKFMKTAGSVVGAGVGTVILPLVGTLIGSRFGTILGDLAAIEAGSAIGNGIFNIANNFNNIL